MRPDRTRLTPPFRIEMTVPPVYAGGIFCSGEARIGSWCARAAATCWLAPRMPSQSRAPCRIRFSRMKRVLEELYLLQAGPFEPLALVDVEMPDGQFHEPGLVTDARGDSFGRPR